MYRPYPSYIRWAVPLLAVILLIVLFMQAWTLYAIYHARSLAKTQIMALIQEIDTVSSEVAHIDIPLNQDIPVTAAVPIHQQVTVPISTTFPVRTSIPIDLLGTTVNLPVNLNVPVRTDVPVTINTTVNLSTSVQVDLNVPLDLPISATPLDGYLKRLREVLTKLEKEL